MDEALRELRPFLDSRGRLTALPAKHRKLMTAVWYLAGKIEAGRTYTEPEINDLLDGWAVFRDPATLRRELFNTHLLDRAPDGSRYRRADAIPPLGEFLNAHV